KHRDNLIGLFQRIFIALNWFNPLAYIISASYSLTREDICDDYAIQMISDSTRYTTCLVNLAEKSCLISSFKPAIGLVGCKRSLTKRLQRLLGKEESMNAELTRTKKWMLAGLCATVVLCCAGIQTVFAQDYEAVGKRLRKAVAAGELTGEQARAMLGTLRKASQLDNEARDREAAIEGVVKRVRTAVADGKLTPEQGRARLQDMRKRMAEGTRETRAHRGEHGEEGRDSRARYAAAEKEIQAAIEAGKITRAQGRERLAGLRRHLAGGGETRERRGEHGEEGRDSRARYAAAEKRVQVAIKAGQITEAQGKERLSGLKRHLAGARGERAAAGRTKQRNTRIEYAAAEKRIQVAIKAGQITEAQAKERLVGLKKRLAGEGGDRAAAGRTAQRNRRIEYAAAEKRVQVAIKAGQITEAQGKERLAGLKRRLAGARSGEGRDLEAMNEAVEKRIREAIRGGKMTKEEGKAAYEGMMKRMAAGARVQRMRGERTRGERTRERDPKAVYLAAEKEIKAAIRAGKITEEQGKKRLAGLRRHLAAGAREAESHHAEHGEEGEHESRGERTHRR
ncbi:MAG: hypothetical protein GY809_31600, partial [Planctomycetes bacterium]|nr:hypothetical protein [Planctomycetota bacterium]